MELLLLSLLVVGALLIGCVFVGGLSFIFKATIPEPDGIVEDGHCLNLVGDVEILGDTPSKAARRADYAEAVYRGRLRGGCQ